MANEIKSINQHDALASTVTEDEINVLVELLASGADPATQEHLKVCLGTIIQKNHYTKSEIATLLAAKVSASSVGQANGVASLDAYGRVPESQMPLKADDVIEGWLYNGVFYTTSAHTTAITGEAGKIYIDMTNGTDLYRYDTAQSKYVDLISSLLQAALNGEIAARQTETADIQSQIVNLNSELDNIEALIGDEAEVENTDPESGTLLAQSRLIHHPSLLPNGKFGCIGARSLAYNQIAPTLNSFSVFQCSRTSYSDGIATMSNFQSGSAQTYRTGGLTIGHKYLIAISVNPSAASIVDAELGTSPLGQGKTTTANKWQTFAWVATAQGAGFSYHLDRQHALSTSDTMMLKDSIVRDLTIIYGAGNEPSSVNDIPAWMLVYTPQDNGTMYDLNPSGFRIRGFNIYDGTYTDNKGLTNGVVVDNNQRWVTDYISVTGSAISCNLGGSWAFFDINKNLISYENKSLSVFRNITLPSGTAYVRFDCIKTTVLPSGFQVALGTYTQTRMDEYHPYDERTILTPQISDGHYVNDTVYDYVENVEENGVLTGKFHNIVGTVTYDGSSDESWTSTTYNRFYISLNTLARKSNYTGSILCTRLVSVSDHVAVGANEYSISGYYDSGNSYPNQNWLYINVGSSITTVEQLKTWLASNPITVNYELVAESVSNCEPLRSFGISDYSTVESITPQTSLVNRIDVPFSIKTKSANTLIQQITQNTADIAVEKTTRAAQVSTLNKRVTNLELKTGDILPVTYPSDDHGMDGVPSNVEPYAKVKELILNSRVHNQLIEHGTFDVPNDSNGWSFNRCSWVSTTNNKMTVSANDSGSSKSIYRQPPIKPTGHKLLVTYTLTSSVATHCRVGIFGSQTTEESLSANTRTTFSEVLTPNYNADYAFLYFDTQSQMVSGDTVVVEDFCITDLTQYFNGTIPSDADTIAKIRQNYPELLVPSEYDTGTTVNTTYSAVKSISKNLFDDDWLLLINGWAKSGDYYTGMPNADRTAIYAKIASDLDPKIAGNRITLSFKGYNASSGTGIVFRINYTDSSYDTVAVNSTTETTFTLTSNVGKTVLSFGITYSLAIQCYIKELQVEIGASATSYSPYGTLDNLTLPSPVTGKSAGSVHEVYYPETGEQTNKLKTVKFSTIGWVNETDYIRGNISDMRKPLGSSDIRITCTKMVSTTPRYSGALASLPVMTICQCADSDGTTDKIYFKLASGVTLADLANEDVTYELATPNPNSQVTEPVLDPFVKVEGGGTIRPIQTQTTQIDSAMSVEYMAS